MTKPNFVAYHPNTHGEVKRLCTEDGEVYGAFYGSYDKLLHLAYYVPYARPPGAPICNGNVGHLTAAGRKHPLCTTCFADVPNILRTLFE